MPGPSQGYLSQSPARNESKNLNSLYSLYEESLRYKQRSQDESLHQESSWQCAYDSESKTHTQEQEMQETPMTVHAMVHHNKINIARQSSSSMRDSSSRLCRTTNGKKPINLLNERK